MHRTLWATLSASLLFVAAVGCADEPCPPGQVEWNGECVDVTGDATAMCGPGTFLLPGEDTCRPDPNVVCGAGTEIVYLLDENGVATPDFYCKGVGGGDTPLPPECPEATPGGPICLNGWIRYLIDPEDPEKLLETLARFESPTLKVVVYDPLAYAVNPNVAPLGVGEVVAEDGTFKVENVAVPGTGFLALVVEDDDNSGADDYVFTGFAYEASAGNNMELVNAYTVTAAQNVAWTASIGQPNIATAGCGSASADSLYTCGTWVGVFGYGNPEEGFTLIEGVSPQKFPGPAILDPTKAFYLGLDHDSFVAPTGAADNYTNATGVVFYPGARLGSYTGACAAGTSCDTEGYDWDQVAGTTGGAAPNAFFVQLMEPIGFE